MRSSRRERFSTERSEIIKITKTSSPLGLFSQVKQFAGGPTVWLPEIQQSKALQIYSIPHHDLDENINYIERQFQQEPCQTSFVDVFAENGGEKDPKALSISPQAAITTGKCSVSVATRPQNAKIGQNAN